MDDKTLFIDFVNIASFVIGLQNLEENEKQIKELQEHLKEQDEQYNKIIEMLNNLK